MASNLKGLTEGLTRTSCLGGTEDEGTEGVRKGTAVKGNLQGMGKATGSFC